MSKWIVNSDGLQMTQNVIRWGLVACIVVLGGCATNDQRESNDLVQEDGWSEELHSETDPYESFNRKMFSLNLTLDKWILKPTAKAYVAITPEPVELGVRNFFENLTEVSNIANDLLQWKWRQAGNDTARLLTNSTIGILGLFDVASRIGLVQSDGEDFGQTLARWGVKQGPYLVLPIIGPSTLRDGLASPVDSYFLDPVTYVEPKTAAYGLRGLRLIDTRVQLFEIEDLVSGDMYLFVREAYLQRRNYLERDGELEEGYEDEFGGEDF